MNYIPLGQPTMKLTSDDFHLDEQQIALINQYIDEQRVLSNADLTTIIFTFNTKTRNIEVRAGRDERGINLR